MTIYRHAALQFGLALLLFLLWTAADSWYLLTGLVLANSLSVLTAALAGVALATIFHEWSHFAGTVLGGSRYGIPGKPGLFVYEFDFEHNSLRQFNIMSLAGQAGSWLAVLGIFLAIPLDNAGRAMLLASAVGSAVFGGVIEWPVLRRSQRSGKPAEELAGINTRALQVGALSGIAVTLSLWFWIAP